MKKLLLLGILSLLSTSVYSSQKDIESARGSEDEHQKTCCERTLEIAGATLLYAGNATINGGIWAVNHGWQATQWTGKQLFNAGAATVTWYQEQRRLYEIQQIKSQALLLAAVLETKNTDTPNKTNSQQSVTSELIESNPMSPFENVSRPTSPCCDLLGAQRKNLEKFYQNQSNPIDKKNE